jgi:hypothetical protein
MRAEGAPFSFSPLRLSDVARRRATKQGGLPVAEGTPLAGRNLSGTGPAEPEARGWE